jgi:penicillin amidase
MRYFLFLLATLVTVGLVVVLDTRKVLPAPLGKLLSPQEGIWQNTEPVQGDFSEELRITGLKGKVEVYLDERLVPHIHAEQEADAYFVQGYLHAKFRLWQMEFQTMATAGRLSEIVGEKAVHYDRTQRRIGLAYGAENALREMEKDAQLKEGLDAYTAGVNAYIHSLSSSSLPLEYKLLGYEPEEWNNLKTALFTKALTNTLSGFDRDFEQTNALRLLGEDNFRALFPEVPDSLDPVIPRGTAYKHADTIPVPPPTADSLYYHRKDSIWFTGEYKPDPSNGSNNWAVSGSKTKSGKPILCNDPHLSLTLPSIWYEMQISCPAFSAYGVSFPGIPGVVIGFNEHVAFGFTNSGRDVKDYYEIKFKDASRSQYWFNNAWKDADLRVEKIRLKGGGEVLDTVAYTVFGPVTYDQSFTDKLHDGKAYALRWTAHDPSNILRMWYQLNRAKNYSDYEAAIKFFNAPGQNMIFASKDGDIALWQQAQFPLRWKDQGHFVMPGFDSSYMWKGFIPQDENPHVVNPAQGFISSANQRATDTSYPYFIPGSYEVYRPITINRRLRAMDGITPDDMKKLQTDNYNVFAEYARPLLMKYIDANALDESEKGYLKLINDWNLRNDPQEKAATCFVNWWDSLEDGVIADELHKSALPIINPDHFVVLEGLLRDSTAYRFIDDIRTPEKETLSQLVTGSFHKAATGLRKLEAEGKLEWGRAKNTTIYHLLRNNAMPFAREGVYNGGGKGVINATQQDHGPSWRMIVHLTTPTEAYAVYPGGQSGNPGSPYYDNFIATWAKGAYYPLWFMQNGEEQDKRVKWTMTFKP